MTNNHDQLKGSLCKSSQLNAHRASQTASLATNGDIQAINAESPNMHIYLHNVQKVDEAEGKIVINHAQ